jgi:penicillin-binding protein 1A
MRLLRYAILTVVWGALGLFVLLLPFLWDLPKPESALETGRRPSLTIEDRSGHILASYGDVVGEPRHVRDLPAFLPAAAVAVEDRRFYWHFGLDPVGMARAAYVNLRAHRVVQGGSTLTQQVAKNLFLSNARTFKRKVQEVLLTLWLEHRFSKKEILEIWLNRVYLGSGAWGMDAAAQIYFGIPATKLNLWQSAVLAGLARAPSRFNPHTNPSAAAARGAEVLAAMAENGTISKAQANQAAAEINFPPRPPSSSGWFADWIADRSAAIIPPASDAALRTTLDPKLQAIAEQKLSAVLDRAGKNADAGQGAVIALDATTGAVRAMVGGRDYKSSPFNRAVLARRQPGSAFKPFVFLTALDDGATPDDVISAAPIRVAGWSPSNFERGEDGDMTLETALARSVNTASVRLLVEHGGAAAVAATARRLGITSKLPSNPSLALGTSEVRLLELAGTYAAFFNGGNRVTPYGIDSVTLNGHQAAGTRERPETVMSPEESQQMARMLAAVVSRGSGKEAAIPGHLVAGKTGTTQDSRDAWFIGCVDKLIIGVWIGNDDNHPMDDVMGGTLPAQVFHDIALARFGG